MKISFDLKIDDWMAFQEYYRSKKAPYMKALTPLLFITAVVLIIINAIYLSYQKVSIVTVASCFILVTILYLFFMKKKSKDSLRKMGMEMQSKNPEAFGLREMSFDEKGIEIKTSSSSKSLSWEEMERYDENKDYFFLYSKKGIAYIIPKQNINTEIIDIEQLLNEHI